MGTRHQFRFECRLMKDERLQPALLAASDPPTRLATAITILLRYLAADRSRARLASHAAAGIPGVSRAVFARLREDLAGTQAAGCLALPSLDLAARIVSAVFLQAARDIGRGRIGTRAIPAVIGAILRAIGCTPDDAASHAPEAARIADNFAHALAATRPRPASRW